MPELTDEDKSLFLNAVQDAENLPPSNKVSAYKKALKPVVKKLKNSPKSTRPGRFSDDFNFESTQNDRPETVSAHQSLEFKQPSVTTQDMQKLRKGQFKTHWELDLHGLTELKADEVLSNFIREALQYAARYLIIVHGKGYNSDTDSPVLKNLVNYRLMQIPHILAYCSAQPKDGGTGAVYVFLKKSNPEH